MSKPAFIKKNDELLWNFFVHLVMLSRILVQISGRKDSEKQDIEQ